MVADDEALVLQDILQMLKETEPEHEYIPFSDPHKAIQAAETEKFDAAFLDIEMGTVNGIVMAKQLKQMQPHIHIIFVTSYAQYAVEAFSIHATGYLMKPVAPEDIRRELRFLYEIYPGSAADADRAGRKRIQVRTFGGFDVYVDGVPLSFKRTKSKELLAYLVDRRGSSVTLRDAANILFEDGKYDFGRKSYMQTIYAELRSTLHRAGAEEMLQKRHNSYAVNTSAFDCDSYRYLQGDPIAINNYRNDYMICYSWAEYAMGLEERRE